MSFWKKKCNEPSISFDYKKFELNGHQFKVSGVPETCPHCNKIVGMNVVPNLAAPIMKKCVRNKPREVYDKGRTRLFSHSTKKKKDTNP